MCKHLKVWASGYYDWYGRVPSKHAAANVTLLAQIEAAHLKSDATYGMPRIRAELADQGVVASRKRIAAVMRCAQICGVSRRRGYVVTTRSLGGRRIVGYKRAAAVYFSLISCQISRYSAAKSSKTILAGAHFRFDAFCRPGS